MNRKNEWLSRLLKSPLAFGLFIFFYTLSCSSDLSFQSGKDKKLKRNSQSLKAGLQSDAQDDDENDAKESSNSIIKKERSSSDASGATSNEPSSDTSGDLSEPMEEMVEETMEDTSTDEQKAQPNGTPKEDVLAQMPTEVSGAFLTCGSSSPQEVSCALNLANGTKVAFSSDPQAVTMFQMSDGTTMVVPSLFVGSDPRWHWKITSTAQVLEQVTRVSVQFPARVLNGAIYHSIFNLRPVRIGDGTANATQGGCSNETANRSVAGGVVYSKSFTVTTLSFAPIVLSFVRLCGIVRANDSFARLYYNNIPLERKFLPTMNREIDYRLQFANRGPGTYRVELVPGNQPDIDDFMFYDLTISYQ